MMKQPRSMSYDASWDVASHIATCCPRLVLVVLKQHIARPGSAAQRRLTAETAAAGLPCRRLEFPERVPQAQYFRRIASSDLALDVPRWNGVSSTLDILWAGSPLVALAQQLMLSRMSKALLHNLGVPHTTVASARSVEDLTARLMSASLLA